MSTVVLRNTKGSALTFTELDNNFSNLNSDKLEQVVSDTTPQLGGNLDVNGNSIVSTSAGNISITPDTTGKIILDGLSWPTSDGTAGYYLKTDGAGNLSWASVDTDTNTTYTVSAVDSGTDAIIRLTGSDASTDDVTLVAGTNITLTPSGDNITIAATGTGIANVVEDTTPQLGGDLDVQANAINTSTTNGNITLTANGTGGVNNTTGLYVGGNYASSGYAILTGNTGVGTLIAANQGATGSTDATITVDSGGGLIVDAGSGSTLTLSGNLIDAGGTTVQDTNLKNYKETIHSLGSTDTPSIDVANGNVQSVTITSGLTLPAFSNAETGQSVTLIVSGSGTASGTAAYKFAGGNTTLTTDSVVSIFYDGTTYFASIATDFS